jgi:hypothetical protein
MAAVLAEARGQGAGLCEMVAVEIESKLLDQKADFD